MFDNIGSNLKTAATIICWAEIVICFIAAISLMFIDDGIFPFLGLLLLFIGPFTAWVSSLIIYGLGQLVENSNKLVAQHNVQPTGTKPIETVYEKMQELNKWKQQGLITEAEYMQKLEMLKNEQK
ncbi:MAG: hypothetical protein J6M35_09300 [Clostridia bacterium]|nr:hypothetical protein [Clostridia bacterium]